MIALHDFKNWIHTQTYRLLDVSEDVSEKRIGDEKVMIITHETKQYIGQITVRNSGSITMEILSVHTEELVFYLYFKSDKMVDMNSLFENYFSYLYD